MITLRDAGNTSFDKIPQLFVASKIPLLGIGTSLVLRSP